MGILLPVKVAPLFPSNPSVAPPGGQPETARAPSYYNIPKVGKVGTFNEHGSLVVIGTSGNLVRYY